MIAVVAFDVVEDRPGVGLFVAELGTHVAQVGARDEKDALAVAAGALEQVGQGVDEGVEIDTLPVVRRTLRDERIVDEGADHRDGPEQMPNPRHLEFETVLAKVIEFLGRGGRTEPVRQRVGPRGIEIERPVRRLPASGREEHARRGAEVVRAEHDDAIRPRPSAEAGPRRGVVRAPAPEIEVRGDEPGDVGRIADLPPAGLGVGLVEKAIERRRVVLDRGPNREAVQVGEDAPLGGERLLEGRTLEQQGAVERDGEVANARRRRCMAGPELVEVRRTVEVSEHLDDGGGDEQGVLGDAAGIAETEPRLAFMADREGLDGADAGPAEMVGQGLDHEAEHSSMVPGVAPDRGTDPGTRDDTVRVRRRVEA